MKVLVCAGEKTHVIVNALVNLMQSTGTTFLQVTHIDDIKDIFQTGKYFDRALIVQQGWTYDGTDTDENSIRRKINDFANDIKKQQTFNTSYVFLTKNNEMADIVNEEIMSIAHNSAIVVKEPKYNGNFFARLASDELVDLPNLYVPTTTPEVAEEAPEVTEETPDNTFDNVDEGNFETPGSSVFDNDVFGGGFAGDIPDTVDPDFGAGDLGYKPPEPQPGPVYPDNPPEQFTEPQPSGDFNDPEFGDSKPPYDYDAQGNAPLDQPANGYYPENDDYPGQGNQSGYGDTFNQPYQDDVSGGDYPEPPSDEMEQEPYPQQPYPEEPYPQEPYPQQPYPQEPYPQAPYNQEYYPTEQPGTEPYPQAGAFDDDDYGNNSKSGDNNFDSEMYGSGDENNEPGPEKNIVRPKLTKKQLKATFDAFANRGNNIVVTGFGGSGTSTLAFNLANTICNLGYTVLLVDMDTKYKTQSYLSKDSFDAVDVDSANVMAAVNSTSGINAYTSIVRQGFHLLTMGMASDSKEARDAFKQDRLAKFMSQCKASHNFVIFDIPFDDLVGSLSQIGYSADNVIINIDASNWGISKALIGMCNIGNDDIEDTLFSRGQIIFNRYKGMNKLFGKKVKSLNNVTDKMDEMLIKLNGEDPGYRFANMHVIGAIKFSKSIEEFWFGQMQYSDTQGGLDEYIEILKRVLLENKQG